MVKRAAFFGLVLLSLWAGLAWAGEEYKQIYPLFIDLPGWEASAPEGVSMSSNGENMVTVTRTYTKGDAAFSANVMAGTAAVGASAGYQNISMETDDVIMKSGQRKGFETLATWYKVDKNGNLLVLLGGKGGNHVAVFTFENVENEEGLRLAESFDWSAIEAGLAKILP